MCCSARAVFFLFLSEQTFGNPCMWPAVSHFSTCERDAVKSWASSLGPLLIGISWRDKATLPSAVRPRARSLLLPLWPGLFIAGPYNHTHAHAASHSFSQLRQKTIWEVPHLPSLPSLCGRELKVNSALVMVDGEKWSNALTFSLHSSKTGVINECGACQKDVYSRVKGMGQKTNQTHFKINK